MRRRTLQTVSTRPPDARPDFLDSVNPFPVPFVRAAIVGFLLLAVRIFLSARLPFGFLFWNLFLAWLPLVFAIRAAREFSAPSPSRLRVTAWLMAWMLFLPNAPYLVTDLLHWRSRPPVPTWYDLLLLLHFAGLGLALGFRSLQIVEQSFVPHVPPTLRTLLRGGLFLAVSFGIVLGRWGRWNSWNVVTDPIDLANSIGKQILNPAAYPRTWAFTVVGAAVMWSVHGIFSERLQPRSMGGAASGHPGEATPQN